MFRHVGLGPDWRGGGVPARALAANFGINIESFLFMRRTEIFKMESRIILFSSSITGDRFGINGLIEKWSSSNSLLSNYFITVSEHFENYSLINV